MINTPFYIRAAHAVCLGEKEKAKKARRQYYTVRRAYWQHKHRDALGCGDSVHDVSECATVV